MTARKLNPIIDPRRHSLRNPISGQWAPAPPSVDKRMPVAPLLEAEFKRYTLGLEQKLRHEFGRRHGVRASNIPFSTRLAIKSLAHVSAKLEVLTERQTSGVPVDDELVCQLAREQSRRLKALGLAEATIKPRVPAKPAPSLGVILRAQAVPR